eukprot:TRINITY_DN3460_c0_g1_i2.p1 TRINITY_DN3460_c0_g1~~TRINITY_DN3460_c0_g1_i2.p1  ORF type:complete len:411 (+),score=61.80 TRINITY_DN3460_c0_g1_i2:517-1749(+)
MLPDEIYFKICDKLPEKSIGILKGVSKRWFNIAQENSIWEKKARHWNLLGLGPMEDMDWNKYVEYYLTHETNETYRLERERVERKQEKRLRKFSRIDTRYQKLFVNRISYDWVVSICIVVWTVLVPLKLDGIFNYTWHLVNSPWYFAIARTIFNYLLFDITIARNDESIIHNLPTLRQAKSILKGALFGLKHRLQHYLVMATLLCFFLFMAENLDGNQFINHWVVISPFLWLICLWWISACTGCGEQSNLFSSYDCCGKCMALLLVVLIKLFIIGMVWMKAADLVEISWWSAMTPFWIILIIAALIVFGTACALQFQENIRHSILGGLVTLGVLFGVFYWIYMLCDNLTSLEQIGFYKRKWVVVFIPIYVFDAFVLTLCGIIDILIFANENNNNNNNNNNDIVDHDQMVI